MKFDIIISLLPGTWFFLLVLCVLDARAEFNVQPNLSPISSVKPATLEPKVFRRARQWTVEEDMQLIELRGQGMSWDEMLTSFPERSWTALSSRYWRLIQDPSRTRKKIMPWSSEKKNLLVKLVEAGNSYEEIVKYFPGRSIKALKGQYEYLTRGQAVPKRFIRHYTAEEDELLLKLGKEGVPWRERVKHFDDRTLTSLQSRYGDLISPNSTPKRSSGKYTPKEDDAIVEAIELDFTVEEIGQLLERDIRSIKRRIKKLEELNRLPQTVKGSRYTVADFKLMHEMVERGMSWKDIATEFFPERGGSRNARVAYKRYQAQKQKEEE